MLLKLIATGLIFFSGTGLADESNAPRGAGDRGVSAPDEVLEREDAPKGSLYVNSWAVAQEGGSHGSGIPGNIYVGKVDFGRQGTYQSLFANVWIGACSGDWGPCRRSFNFSLQCRDDYGNHRTITSPWFYNEYTNGYEYRNYSFYDADVVWCSYVDNIWLNWKYGW